MQAKSDAQLLREYAEQRSEPAFTEIIARHADLVYAAAWRQVGSPDLACDVAQSVFTDLARKARPLAAKMHANASLVGWLYRSTRYAALTILRNERRRQARERQFMQEIDQGAEISHDWQRIRPVLDEAMSNLGEVDREALLLRFFKNQDFRAIGAALGLSDDAAQKRVARGLEKLRADFLRRGLTIGEAALLTAISANAVQAAPVGLAATLTTASLAGAAKTGTTLTLLEFMAATKQFAVIGVIVAGSVLAPVMVQRQAQAKLRITEAGLQAQNDWLARQQAENDRLSTLLGLTTNSPDPATAQAAELLRLRGEVAQLRRDVERLTQPNSLAGKSRSEVLAALAQRYSDRTAQLKQLFEANPSERIPEMQFLTEANWLSVVGQDLPETKEGNERAMSLARRLAEEKVVNYILRTALQVYGQANNGQFPADISHLGPYFKEPLDESILQRWHVVHASKLTNLQPALADEDWIITQKAPVNREFDKRFVFSLKTGYSFSEAPPAHWDTAP